MPFIYAYIHRYEKRRPACYSSCSPTTTAGWYQKQKIYRFAAWLNSLYHSRRAKSSKKATHRHGPTREW